MEETADRIPWAQQTITLGPGIHPSIVSSIVFSSSSFLLRPLVPRARTYYQWMRLLYDMQACG